MADPSSSSSELPLTAFFEFFSFLDVGAVGGEAEALMSEASFLETLHFFELDFFVAGAAAVVSSKASSTLALRFFEADLLD